MSDQPKNDNLKTLTARSMKWNVVDKFSSQLLYGVTGIILARILSQEEFGLVGAMAVFQAFASMFIDSGFSYALIQRKQPTKLEYSTVLWFNIAMATVIYIILFFSAPLIAKCFGGDERLIPLSRVMFLSFIINASGIVQANRLIKQMNVRMIAVSNAIGLAVGSVVAITLALWGFGAWAVVWQVIVLNTIKSLTLWLTSNWRPLCQFSFPALRSFFAVGSGMMATSFLNVLFQNIYSFFIGIKSGLVSLGYYSQSDKWSKMGISSLSQVLTSTFLPPLSHVQDDPERFTRLTTKMNRLTAYLAMPFMGMLIVMATPIFHSLFGVKWDASIPLFQLLLLRGIFTILCANYNNYLVAVARTRLVVSMELLRDVSALILLIITLPGITLQTEDNPVFGITLLLYGQVLASTITWAVMAWKVAKITGRKVLPFIWDNAPYAALTLVSMFVMMLLARVISNSWILLGAQAICGLTIYLGLNHLGSSAIQRDVLAYIFAKKH